MGSSFMPAAPSFDMLSLAPVTSGFDMSAYGPAKSNGLGGGAAPAPYVQGGLSGISRVEPGALQLSDDDKRLVEEFLRRPGHQVDPNVADALRSCPPDVQRIVINKGT